MTRRTERAASFAVVLCALFTVAALAQDYPARPVRFVVPFAPGGGTDLIARIAAQKLGERLGAQFIVENRSSAGGIVGSAMVAKARPDGSDSGAAGDRACLSTSGDARQTPGPGGRTARQHAG